MRNTLVLKILTTGLAVLASITVIFVILNQSFDLFQINTTEILLFLLPSASILGAVSIIAYRYIQPIKKITNEVASPDALSEYFYSHPHLTSEIKDLIVQIIRAQKPNDSGVEKLSEQTLFRALYELLEDGIIVTDGRGDVILMNASARRLFEIEGGETLGSSLTNVVRNFKINNLWQYSRSTQRRQVETIEIAQTKSTVSCLAAPLNPEDHGGILLLFKDITRLHQLETVRRDFVSNVSHELRTPLTTLKLITETLQGGALDDPKVADKFLGQMDSEVDNLTQLVQELLELSRIESAQVPLDRIWISPENLIHDAGERMAMQAERAGLQFFYRCEDTLPRIFVDKQRLGQVLINLIHNALKFTPPGGEINVSAEKENDQVIFSIKDNGVGIPVKDIGRIFERFYKSDRSRTQRGTGLGLSISKHLVEKHGGKIWVESSRESGSTFYFSIPINHSA